MDKKKSRQINCRLSFLSVGVTRFELATTRPPDAYSNLAELHPGAFIKSAAKLSPFYLMCNSSRVFFTNFHIVVAVKCIGV